MNKKYLKKVVQLPVLDRLFQSYLTLRNWKSRRHMKDKKTMEMVYKYEDLNKDYYEAIKRANNRKLEHQIGRLTNFKQIVKSCANLEGHFIEFGSWRGFSLLWIAYFIERNAIFNKKLIGIDSFDGIPYAEGQFFKKQYQDTSLRLCKNNVLNNSALYRETRENILIAKYWCKEKDAIMKYLRDNHIDKLCFIHLDLDVSRSTVEIFDILLAGDFIADRAYILFDDWGCECDIPAVVNNIFEQMRIHWRITEHSSTNLTKNFLVERILTKN